MKNLFKLLSTLFFALFIHCTSFCQIQNILISNTNAPEEPAVAINPNNTNQIVVGSNVNIGNNYTLAYYFSSNSGYNWSSGTLTSTNGTPYCDPCVAVDADGNFYYSCLRNRNPTDNIFIFKSTNGGMNWSDGVYFGQVARRQADMPSMCIDVSNSIYRNNIYMIWTGFGYHSYQYDTSEAYFARSTDNGLTFNTPQKISSASCSYVALISCLCCTGPNSEVYAVWYNMNGIAFQKSTDGGITWLANDIQAMTQTLSWRENYLCFFNNCISFACDLSNSSSRGKIYISWADTRTGNRSDVWITSSTKGGTNWSTPARINNGPFNTTKAAFYPKLSVDQSNGFLYAAYYDDKYYSNYSDLDFIVARSTDGGVTFENSRVNSNKIYLCTSMPTFYGDYIGISAVNNKIRPVWMNAQTSFAIYTAIIDTFTIGIRKIETELPDTYKLFQNYPNPFNPSTIIKFQVKDSRLVILKVYNILGKEIATLVNEKLSPGVYEIPFSGKQYNNNQITSGVYFYKIIAIDPTNKTGLFTDTRKLILIK